MNGGMLHGHMSTHIRLSDSVATTTTITIITPIAITLPLPLPSKFVSFDPVAIRFRSGSQPDYPIDDPVGTHQTVVIRIDDPVGSHHNRVDPDR